MNEGQRMVESGRQRTAQTGSLAVWVSWHEAQWSFPFSVPSSLGGEDSCETKPIWRGVSSVKWQVSSEPCETNPIPGCAGWPAAWGTWDVGFHPRPCGLRPFLLVIVRNKANFLWAGRTGRGSGGSLMAVARGQKCAKQTQFVPKANDGQVLCRKGVRTNSARERHRQNKANLRRGRGSGIGVQRPDA